MTNPLVSIIVPVYNAQKGLSRCLESICSQTYQELEIIVLNDGSTDDSLAICEQFRAKDPRLVVVDKENEGVSRTRNAGLALAQGDYIQFADSDDVLDPDYTQNLVQAALQHSADLVIAPYWMVIPSNSSKTGHALETLQESLGIEPEAPKTEVHKYGFLPQGVYSREDYARRLMQQPASFYYGVLWKTSLALRPMSIGRRICSSTWGISNTRRCSFPSPMPGITISKTPKASATPRSTCAGSWRTKRRSFSCSRRCTPALDCTRSCSPRSTNSCSPFRKAVCPRTACRALCWMPCPA